MYSQDVLPTYQRMRMGDLHSMIRLNLGLWHDSQVTTSHFLESITVGLIESHEVGAASERSSNGVVHVDNICHDDTRNNACGKFK